MTITQTAAPTGTAHILYLMHALSPFTAWLLALLALVVGAITRDTVRGTWVETHYAWLLRTCLWGILWAVIAGIVTVLMAITIILIPLAWVPLTIVGVWYLYRVIRGWLRLNDRLPAP